MNEFNPYTQDPIYDKDYPASQETFPIYSKGSILNAIIEIAQGKGPHLTILLLHGFPGNEKNFDLAHIFRRAGYNVLIFYYRGSWGSGGSYSFQNCIQDVEFVLKYLRNEENSARLRVDKDKIILIGHSWGGFVALFAGVTDKKIQSIASISGFNIGSFGKFIAQKAIQPEILELLDDVGPLNGTSSEALLNEILEMKTQWDLTDYAKQLSNINVCLVGALNDEVLPIEFHHRPLVEAINNFSPNKLTQHEFNTTHSYSDHRLKLSKFLLKWLNGLKSIHSANISRA